MMQESDESDAVPAVQGPQCGARAVRTTRKRALVLDDSDVDEASEEDSSDLFKARGEPVLYDEGDDGERKLHELLYKCRARVSSETHAIHGYRPLFRMSGDERMVRTHAARALLHL